MTNPDQPTIKGYVDGLKGAYVAGWAISTERPVCDIVVADEDYRVVAQGQASLERPDLAALGRGRSNFAFSIPVPTMHRLKLVRVTADGVELQRSPQALGPGIYDGQVSIVRGRIEGWATERVVGARAPRITLIDQDGTLMLDVDARFEAASPDRLFAPARFAADMPEAFFGRSEIRLAAFANGEKFAETIASLPLKGFLETLSPERVSGWLLAPAAPTRTLSFDIWRNGTKLCRVSCDLARADLRTAYPGTHRGGFDVTLPEPEDKSALATLAFRLPGATRDLFEGPYLLGGRAAMVAAARAAAQSTGHPIVQAALTDFIARARATERIALSRQAAPTAPETPRRLTIVIPIYRGLQITRQCIDSVLACRTQGDRIVLVNDASPEPGMAALLNAYTAKPDLAVLTNTENLGFVRSCNRGIDFAGGGDVLLLNSDTRIFPGGIGELRAVAYGSENIGTVTAISNNATIFSYPHPDLCQETLPDIGWEALAAIALQKNAGQAIDVPTGHGFCLFIKRILLHRIGHLDEAFGRGYGEENDFCARAADLGFRNVAAPAVLVEHREGTSFTTDKQSLLATNLALLERRFPEYHATIRHAARQDDLRTGRWALDEARLARARQAGATFALVICNSLGGGTAQAIADIDSSVGYGDRTRLTLRARPDGMIEFSAATPPIRAIFAPEESTHLFHMLIETGADLVLVHQLLGFPMDFIRQLRAWLAGRHSIFHGHDFYPMCPCVTLIDATGHFCGLAPTGICARCIHIGGAHESSRLQSLTPAEHRLEFSELLAAFTHIVTPSVSTRHYYQAAFPNLVVHAVPHPHPPIQGATTARTHGHEITLFGAIGAHKGSAKLLEIAQLARLTHPNLTFRIIGHTNIDDELRKLGNTTITGPYAPADLDSLAADSSGHLALFLSNWPETYSYTLTEAVRLGFWPLVPDIGAPAERVRATKLGDVFAFPSAAADVLALIAARTAIEIPPPRRAAFLAAPAGQMLELYGLQKTRKTKVSKKAVLF